VILRLRPGCLAAGGKGGHMRWLFLVAGVAAVAMLFGVGPSMGLLAAFVALGLNFATFCIQYDDPVNRARNRVNHRISLLSPGGVHTEELQRLQSSALNVTTDDRRVRYTFLTWVNLASGVASVGLLMWGLALRVF
jgi:hypothetical protein